MQPSLDRHGSQTSIHPDWALLVAQALGQPVKDKLQQGSQGHLAHLCDQGASSSSTKITKVPTNLLLETCTASNKA